MKKPIKNSGFTLVEILIVVTIIALLAAIVIPNLLRAKMSANDASAKSTLRAISTASESFSTFNGNYPVDITSLTGSNPAYLRAPYCGQSLNGYTYDCTFSTTGYAITANPQSLGSSGSTTYSMSTGGVLSP